MNRQEPNDSGIVGHLNLRSELPINRIITSSGSDALLQFSDQGLGTGPLIAKHSPTLPPANTRSHSVGWIGDKSGFHAPHKSTFFVEFDCSWVSSEQHRFVTHILPSNGQRLFNYALAVPSVPMFGVRDDIFNESVRPRTSREILDQD